jgi:integrase
MSINRVCKSCHSMRSLTVPACTCGSTSHKFKVRVHSANGWLTKTVPSLTLARRVEVKFKNQSIEEGTLGITKAPLIEYAWKKYLAYAELHKTSWRDDRSRWEHHIRLTGKMDKVSPRRIQKIIDDMDKAPATKRQVLQLINRLFNWSIKNQIYRGLNPCLAVTGPKVSNRMNDQLSPEQMGDLFDVLKDEPNREAALVILYAFYTGKRKGEILKLEWSDIDWDQHLVTYRDTKNTETVTIPVNQSAMDVLEEALEIKKAELVFPCSTGKYYYSFNRTWCRIREKAGLSCRFHAARHTFASTLASSGRVDVFALKELLGHRDIKMTMRYSHILNRSLKKAAEVMDIAEDIRTVKEELEVGESDF